MTFAQIALALFFVLLFGAMWVVAFADGRPTRVRRRRRSENHREAENGLARSRR